MTKNQVPDVVTNSLVLGKEKVLKTLFWLDPIVFFKNHYSRFCSCGMLLEELKTKKARAYAHSLTLVQIMESHKHQPKQLHSSNNGKVNKKNIELWEHNDPEEELECL